MDTYLRTLYNSSNPAQDGVMLVILFMLVLMIALVFIVLLQVGAVFNILAKRAGEATWQESFRSMFGQFYNEQAGLKPVAAEADMLLNHDYDGIKELDNHLPPWWKNLFYVTIVFSVIYGFLYHFTDTWSLQEGEYLAELEVAEKEKIEYEKTQINGINENTVKLLTDASTLGDGKKIFTTNCAACHAADGGGGVGPNLTDQYWLHGNKPGEVFKTIKYGVAGKGMTAWQATLNPKQIQAVTSYVISLQGTKPANGKEPQGKLVADAGQTSGREQTQQASLADVK